jgi:hypothetical protein
VDLVELVRLCMCHFPGVFTPPPTPPHQGPSRGGGRCGSLFPSPSSLSALLASRMRPCGGMELLVANCEPGH